MDFVDDVDFSFGVGGGEFHFFDDVSNVVDAGV